MSLTSEKVNAVFMDCLYRKDESIEGAERIPGIMADYAFNPARLNTHRNEIRALLDELPETFHERGGGGWSFLNACVDKNGNLWGQHPDMERLFVLGQAAGFVVSPFPREMWSALPGSVPYYTVLAG